MSINFLVLDILKPHKPSIVEYAKELEKAIKSVVNIRVVEIDEKTESAEVTISGKRINYSKVISIITKMGGSVHSVDEVCVGTKIIRNLKRV